MKIRVLPSICIVKNGKTCDYIVGFGDLGNTDEFSTEMMEWRIARSDAIEYNGDLLNPPKSGKSVGRQNMQMHKKKIIRGRDDSSDDSDSD